jgi:hypothetical protein
MAKTDLPKLTPEQEKFVLNTQGALAKGAGRTPSRVLKTFYPANITICGYEVSQCGLGILGMLEAIDHPLIAVMLGKEDREVKIADQQRAFYIFAFPRQARGLIAQGMDKFDDAAFEATSGMTVAALAEITAKVTQLIRDGLATMPGVDLNAAPEVAGKDLLDTLAPATPA